MKTPALVLMFLLLNSLAAWSQVEQVVAKPLTDEDIALIRQDVQATKDDIIKDTMQFSEGEATSFWPIYKEYAGEQRKIAEKRFAIIMDYAKNIDTLSDTEAGALTQRLLQTEDETQALRKKYLPKFEGALGGKRAAKFYQVDNRLTMIVNIQLASEVPLIP